MTRPLHEAADDSRRCYEFAIAVSREQGIRDGYIPPRPGNADEMRWAEEGERPNGELDTVRNEGVR